MKTLNFLKRSGLALVAFCFMLTVANAQARYKHMPRVKIDKQTQTTLKQQEATTAAIITTQNSEAVATEATTPIVENTTVASTSEEVVILETKTTSAVKHQTTVKQNRKVDFSAFTKKIKENSKLMDVKDVKKTALQKWLLYMIICLAVAVLFTILAAALAFTFAYSGLYALIIVFWVIAGLAWIGALVFLILGLAGIM